MIERITHIVPTDDWIEHDTNGTNCICGPDVIFMLTEDVVEIKHHSLDGRELEEEEQYGS